MPKTGEHVFQNCELPFNLITSPLNSETQVCYMRDLFHRLYVSS